MTGGVELDTAKSPGVDSGDVHESGSESHTQDACDRSCHTGSGFTRAKDVHTLESRQAVALSAGDQNVALAH